MTDGADEHEVGQAGASNHAERSLGVGPELILGPVLRWVDSVSATIWVEASRACVVEVLGFTARTFQIQGHHYALLVVDGLESGSSTTYGVSLDGTAVWPEPNAERPQSVVRTTGGSGSIRILVGSCRAAAPHVPPYTLNLAFDSEGRGVDTMWAHAQRMESSDPSSWPSLLLLVGDQIYADDTSPRARERIDQTRSAGLDLEASKVFDYEEYCWLYHEAWSPPSERWLLSTVASAMIFDDHDMVDDWNISASWRRDMEDDDTWKHRAVCGYMSYWVYQHLGNLSPRAVRADGLLERLMAVDDGTAILRAWAEEAFASSAHAGGYEFSHVRHLGDVTVVTIDCRAGRVLDDEERLMVQDGEWEMVRRAALDGGRHVLFATSLPVFLADGIHDLHVWNQRVAAGAWGRLGTRFGERVRRSLDLEDWPAFPRSFEQFGTLLRELQQRAEPFDSLIVASGDIHFSYAARVEAFDNGSPAVWQVVSSPIRNALIPHERSAMRFSLTRAGRAVGTLLRWSARAEDTRPGLDVLAGPFFANNMCEIVFEGGHVTATFEQSTSSDDGEPDLTEVAQIQLSPDVAGRTAQPDT